MSIIKDSKISFAGGEVSPALWHRFDMQKYGIWLKKAKNAVLDILGGFSNRAGFIFCGITKFEDKIVKLLPFEFNQKQAYCLEFGDGYVRIRDNEKLLLSEDASPVEAVSNFREDGIAGLNSAQSADILFLTNGKQIPQMLKRYALDDWRMEEYKAKNGPFMPYNIDDSSTIKLSFNSENQGASVILDLARLVFYKLYNSCVKIDDEVIFSGAQSSGLDEFINNFNLQNNRNFTAEIVSGNMVKFSALPIEGGDLNTKRLNFSCRHGGGFGGRTYDWNTFGTLAGGIGENNNTNVNLVAGKNIFKIGHVGALFKLDKYVEEQKIDTTFPQAMTSAVLKSNGQWRLITSGGWAGRLLIEVSFDLGKTWKEYRTTKSNKTDAPFNENIYGDIDSDDIVYLRLNAKEISGTLNVFFSCEPFKQSCICRIVEYIDEKNVRAIIEYGNIGNIEATDEWAEGSFSNLRGWPHKVFMHEGRLGFARTDSEPDTVWLSKSNDFWDFGVARQVQDDDAITFRALSTKLNEITGLSCLNKITVFTAGNEFVVSSDGPLTQANKQMTPCTNFGAENIDPITVGNRSVFVQKQGCVLRQFGYDYNSDGFNGSSLSTVFKHQLKGHCIKQLVYKQDPENIIMALRDDGILLVLTYFPEEESFSWSWFKTEGEIESLCVIPAKGHDQLWAVVKRNGKRMVERLANRLESNNTAQQVFLDSCAIYNGEETKVMTGLSHLEGLKVNALAGGCVYKNLTVTNGQIILPTAHSIICAGLPYEMEVITLGADNTYTLGAKRRFAGAKVFYQDTCGFACGQEGGIVDEAIFRSDEKYNNPINLKSGVKEINFTSSHAEAAGIVIRQTDPLPLTVSAIVARVDYGD